MDQVTRARVFSALSKTHLYTDDGSIHAFLWNLIQQAAPQPFRVYQDGKLVWLAAFE